MGRPFMILLAVTTLLAVGAVAAGKVVVDRGGAGAVLLLLVLALPAGIGIAALARIAYLDGRASRGSAVAVRELRRRL